MQLIRMKIAAGDGVGRARDGARRCAMTAGAIALILNIVVARRMLGLHRPQRRWLPVADSGAARLGLPFVSLLLPQGDQTGSIYFTQFGEIWWDRGGI